MPILAIVDGVKIMICPRDYLPPHFPAILADQEALPSIATGALLKGGLPAAKLQRVQSWFKVHQDQLAYCWMEIQDGRNPGGMAP